MTLHSQGASLSKRSLPLHCAANTHDRHRSFAAIHGECSGTSTGTPGLKQTRLHRQDSTGLQDVMNTSRRDTPTYKTGFSQTDCFALRDLWQSSPLGSWGWTLRGSGSRRKFVADDSGRGEERAVQGPWWHRLPWRVVTSFDEDENLYPMKRWFWWVAPDDSVHAVL